ncbi:MAG: ComEC/Rec2 family competence protein [Flavobacteriales bacterium]
MYNYGLIKTTLIYILFISIFWNYKITVDSSFHILIFILSIVLGIFKHTRSLSVFTLLFLVTNLHFNNSFPKSDIIKNGNCKINHVKSTSYNLKLLCTCKTNKTTFGSVVYLKNKHLKINKGDVFFVKTDFVKVKDKSLHGEFSYADYLNKKDIYYEAKAIEYWQIEKLKNTSWLNQKQYQISDWINTRLNLYFSKEQSATIKALCFGDKSFMDKAYLEQFRKAGLMHIIAVSGMHVGIIQITLLLFLRLVFGRSKTSVRLQEGITLILLIIFAWICQFTPSVVRSVFMFGSLYLAYFSKRLILPLHILILSGFIVLLIQPLQLFDLGFQFSYLATFGLIISAPFIKKATQNITSNIIKFIVNTCLVSFIAQIFLSPLLFYYFGEIPFWFWLFNIPGFLFVLLILIAVLLFFTIGNLHPLLAYYISKCIGWTMEGFNTILSLINKTEFIFINFRLNNILEALLFCIILFTIYKALFERKWTYIKYIFIGCIAICLIKLKYDSTLFTKEEIVAWNIKEFQGLTYKKADTLYCFSSVIDAYPERVQAYAQSYKAIIKPIYTSITPDGLSSSIHPIYTTQNPNKTECFLFSYNKTLNHYFSNNLNNKNLEYRYFNYRAHSKTNSDKHINLDYGTEILSLQNDIYFYP